jgi:hypothetical protein
MGAVRAQAPTALSLAPLMPIHRDYVLLVRLLRNSYESAGLVPSPFFKGLLKPSGAALHEGARVESVRFESRCPEVRPILRQLLDTPPSLSESQDHGGP